MQIISKSYQETIKIGQRLGQLIKKSLKSKKFNSILIGLCGDLGGGKTTLVKGIAKGLGIKKNITSPSFTLVKEYKKNNLLLFHFDFYRLKNKKDYLNLGFEEYFQKPQSVSLIEWADKIKDLLPSEKLIIKFSFIDQNQRKLLFKPYSKNYRKLIKLF